MNKNSRRLFSSLGLILMCGLPLIAWVGQGLAQTDDTNGAPPGLAVKPGAPPAHPLGESDREAWEWEVVRLVNQARADNGGLPPLKRQSALNAAAYGHSRDMGVLDFFDHINPFDSSTPGDRAVAEGYGGYYVGENIAAGYNSPSYVMQGWMNSPGHRANILGSSYREIGVGYYYDAGDTFPGPWGYWHYWTQDLGRQPGVYPVVVNREAYSTTERVVGLYVYGPSDAQQMRFSNDGVDWSDWETYNPETTWTLAQGGSGTRTVYAQVRTDSQTYQASDDIYYVTNDPILAVNPGTTSFLAQQGAGICFPAAQTVQVLNTGGGVLDWEASESSSWFDVTQNGDTLTVNCLGSAVSGFGLGVQRNDVTITATDALNSPQTVSVQIVIAQELHHNYLPLTTRND